MSFQEREIQDALRSFFQVHLIDVDKNAKNWTKWTRHWATPDSKNIQYEAAFVTIMLVLALIVIGIEDSFKLFFIIS